MSHHLQAEVNPIQTDERLQLPQMVALAADVTRYYLDSDPDRLAQPDESFHCSQLDVHLSVVASSRSVQALSM